MKKILINHISTKSSYPIYIGADILTRFNEILDIKGYSQIFIVTDENVASIFLQEFKQTLRFSCNHIILSAGEEYKNIVKIDEIWRTMHLSGCDRKSLVINLGGGVVTDMGGFAASTYMRGVDFVNIPTTVLAQVDASVGGKTGFNLSKVKNLIGTFSQPQAVLIDVKTLKTLPERDFISGFAEILKHGLIQDAQYLDQASAKSPLQFTETEMIDLITRSCEIKAKVVKADDKESGLRKILNFGHTVGHALEALSLETTQPLTHGEAVALGMLAEAHISQMQNLITQAQYIKIKTAIVNAGLPTKTANFDPQTVLLRMHSDKKNVQSQIKLVLLKNLGEAVYDQQVPDVQIIEAVKNILN